MIPLKKKTFRSISTKGIFANRLFKHINHCINTVICSNKDHEDSFFVLFLSVLSFVLLLVHILITNPSIIGKFLQYKSSKRFLLRVQINCHNQPIQSQHFGENQNQNHSHKQPRLLGRSSDTSIAHNSDRKTSCQSRKSDR